MPRGMPTPKATNNVSAPKCSVTGQVRPMSPITVSSGWAKERPKSPRTTPLSQMRYCCHKGLSSPYRAWSAANCSSLIRRWP